MSITTDPVPRQSAIPVMVPWLLALGFAMFSVTTCDDHHVIANLENQLEAERSQVAYLDSTLVEVIDDLDACRGENRDLKGSVRELRVEVKQLRKNLKVERDNVLVAQEEIARRDESIAKISRQRDAALASAKNSESRYNAQRAVNTELIDSLNVLDGVIGQRNLVIADYENAQSFSEAVASWFGWDDGNETTTDEPVPDNEEAIQSAGGGPSLLTGFNDNLSAAPQAEHDAKLKAVRGRAGTWVPLKLLIIWLVGCFIVWVILLMRRTRRGKRKIRRSKRRFFGL